MNPSVYSRTWTDRDLYPFQSRYIRLQAGNMHYIDEGRGEVILFIHGTPTWSFLYRKFVEELSKDYRCIAIDHLGFGLSDKPESFSGTPQDHAKNLIEFMQKSDIQNITLVVHDFGGPIGLAAGIENPERIKKIVLFNSWLWSTKESEDAQKIDKIINSWLGKFLYLNMNLPVKFLLKRGFSDQHNLPEKVYQHYIKPFPDKKSRQALFKIAKALVGSSDWYQLQWERLEKLTTKDWLIIWGTEDKFMKMDYLYKWKKRLSKSTIIKFKCGHFIQEEKPMESIKLITTFMKK